jgi:excisionase family DNA binding protein
MNTRGENQTLAISKKTAAARWDVSMDTIEKAINEGDLPSYKYGRNVRLLVVDVDKLFRPVK